MSTQTYFDVRGLGRAIHLGAAAYELSLYADQAEMSVTDLDEPERPAISYAGKAGIGTWVRGRSSSAGTHRVINAQTRPGHLTFVELCEFPDGESDVYIYCAEISRGQIQRCAVTKRHLAVSDSPYAVSPPDLQTMVDDDPPRSAPSPHRPTTSGRVGGRALAGNFFG